MKVLVLEDEFLIAMMIVDELEDEGHTVIGPFFRVADAIEQAAETQPDLALLDITLGDGGRGTDAAVILFRDHGVPCLFVSGSMDIANDYKDVAFGILVKPFSCESLKEAIEVAARLIGGERVDAAPNGMTLYRRQLTSEGLL